MPEIIADVSITPIGTQVGIADYIAAAEGVLQRYPDVKAEIYPMSTTLEGELDRVLQAIRDMHEAPFEKGARRISTSIRIDDRRDGGHETMQERVQAVKQKLSV